MKKLITVFVLATLFSFTAAAQTTSNPERQLVEEVIQLYFDGWGTGDSVKVGRAMHPTCHLKFFREGQFTDIDRSGYLGRFKRRERDSNLVTRIVLMDITENIASAKTEIITAKDIFTDYFNLIKTNEGWFIVDKVSVRKPK